MLSSIKNWLDNFINSFQFSAMIFFLSAIFFILGIQIIPFIVILCFACYIFLFQKDTTPIFCLIIAFIISVRDVDFFSTSKFLFFFAIPVVVCLIFHIVFYCKSFKLGSLFFPLIIISILTLTVSGAFSPYKTFFKEGLAYKLICGVVPLFIYLFFFNTLSDYPLMNRKEYLSYSLIFLALAVSFESVAFQYNIIYSIKDLYIYNFSLGWLNTGFAGYFIHFAIASCCYLIVSKKHILPFYIIIVLFIIALIIIENDATFATCCSFLPLYLFFCYISIKQNQKIKYLLISSFFVILFVCICFFVISRPWFKQYAEYHFMNDTGRTIIYKDGWHLFIDAPIFGSGFGSIYHINNRFTINSGYMHSTIIQVLCSMGIAGLIAYIYYFIKRIQIFTKHYTPFNVFMFMGFLTYQAVAMIDNAEFSFLMVYITIITVIIEKENKSNSQTELPLLKLN